MKGVLIIAAGHPYYGKMAAALAATVRCSDKDIPIHLSWAGTALNHLAEAERSLFTSMAEIPAIYCQSESGNKWIRAKMNMYDLTPFEETLYLDCDLLWLKRSPADMMNGFKKCEVTFPHFGISDSAWATLAELKKVYGPGQYWNIHSEMVYFRKGEKAKEYFDKALEVHDSLKVDHTVFAGGIPDELPFSIAGALTKTHPHKKEFRPVFWSKAVPGHFHIYQLSQKFYAFSMAGNRNTNFETDTYNILSLAAYRKLGLQNAYTWKQKRSFLPERKNL